MENLEQDNNGESFIKILTQLIGAVLIIWVFYTMFSPSRNDSYTMSELYENVGLSYGEIIEKYGEPQGKPQDSYIYGGSVKIWYSDLHKDEFGNLRNVYMYFGVEGSGPSDYECIAVERWSSSN